MQYRRIEHRRQRQLASHMYCALLGQVGCTFDQAVDMLGLVGNPVVVGKAADMERPGQVGSSDMKVVGLDIVGLVDQDIVVVLVDTVVVVALI